MDLSRPRFVTQDEALRAALRRLAVPGAPVLVAGRAGVGKSAFARALAAAWTERAGRAVGAPCRVRASEVGGTPALLALVRASGSRPVVLEDVDRLGARGERALAGALRRGGARALVLTLRCDDDELTAATADADRPLARDARRGADGLTAGATHATGSPWRDARRGDDELTRGAAPGAGLPWRDAQRGDDGRDSCAAAAQAELPPLVPELLRLPGGLLRRVYLPPLSERRGDILLLAEHLVPRGVALEPAAARALAAAAWPEQAAGLAAVLRLAAARAEARGERTLSLAALTPLLAPEARAGAALAGGLAALVAEWVTGEALAGLGLRRGLRLVEAALLARTLAATGGRVSAAARQLGVPPSTLKSRLASLKGELAQARAWLP